MENLIVIVIEEQQESRTDLSRKIYVFTPLKIYNDTHLC
jgi:hypothetical protein